MCASEKWKEKGQGKKLKKRKQEYNQRLQMKTCNTSWRLINTHLCTHTLASKHTNTLESRADFDEKQKNTRTNE